LCVTFIQASFQILRKLFMPHLPINLSKSMQFFEIFYSHFLRFEKGQVFKDKFGQ
jgi:hypothetical protein